MQPLKSHEIQIDPIATVLNNVPKIGEKKIALLIDRFGSLQNIAMATLDQLNPLLGPALAQSVWEYFNK